MEEGPVTPLRITRFSVPTTHRATNQHSEKANLYCGIFICVSFTMELLAVWRPNHFGQVDQKSDREASPEPAAANRGGLMMLQS